MGIENLVNQLTTYCVFSESDLKLITSKFHHQHFKSKAYLLQAGQISRHIHFIETGLLRVFHVNDGKEITSYLSSDNGIVSSYSSFIQQTSSYENIQCIEDSEIYSIHYKDMHELYDLVPKWQNMGRIIAEQNVLCLADRHLKLHSIPAKEKYLEFLKTSPDKIIQRTPLIHIASYLGITPESLSRIRKSIS